MHVYLVQHGASKSEAEDPQRNLTDEGRGVIERMTEHLAGAGIPIDRIEHSGKLRARRTPKSSPQSYRTGLRPGAK